MLKASLKAPPQSCARLLIAVSTDALRRQSPSVLSALHRSTSVQTAKRFVTRDRERTKIVCGLPNSQNIAAGTPRAGTGSAAWCPVHQVTYTPNKNVCFLHVQVDKIRSDPSARTASGCRHADWECCSCSVLRVTTFG